MGNCRTAEEMLAEYRKHALPYVRERVEALKQLTDVQDQIELLMYLVMAVAASVDDPGYNPAAPGLFETVQ